MFAVVRSGGRPLRLVPAAAAPPVGSCDEPSRTVGEQNLACGHANSTQTKLSRCQYRWTRRSDTTRWAAPRSAECGGRSQGGPSRLIHAFAPFMVFRCPGDAGFQGSGVTGVGVTRVGPTCPSRASLVPQPSVPGSTAEGHGEATNVTVASGLAQVQTDELRAGRCREDRRADDCRSTPRIFTRRSSRPHALGQITHDDHHDPARPWPRRTRERPIRGPSHPPGALRTAQPVTPCR